jgi:membrane protein YqaA with SNARE-associated domain
VFAAAALDGVGIPLPGAVDAVLVAYVYQRPLLAWAYVFLAASGSMLGCLVLYTIGAAGGEVLIQKRMSPSKYDKIRRDFEEHPVITVALPALLPPPFPFKIFVLSAGAFAMRRTHFLGVILVARLARYGILSLLAIRFGPKVVAGFNQAFRGHPVLTISAILAVVVIALGTHRLRRNPTSQVSG